MVNEGQLPDRYRNPELIARGGMGEVYRAEDADLARVVAVKLLSHRFPDNDAIRGRFTREALAVARLSHAPSTVTIFDVGEHGGRPYIVMEYLPGGSLADRLEREGARRSVVRSTGSARRGALDAAHANGSSIATSSPGICSSTTTSGSRSPTSASRALPTSAPSPKRARSSARPATWRRSRPAASAPPLRATSTPRRRRLRALDGQAAVRTRVIDRRGDRPRERADPAGVRLEPESAARARRRARAGLAKEPGHRFASAADLVEALREALDQAAGTTQIAAVPVAAPAPGRRRHVPLGLVSCSWPGPCSPASSQPPCSPAATVRP